MYCIKYVVVSVGHTWVDMVLVEIIFKLPYTKRQNLIDAKLGTSKTVGNYLMALEDKGFLKSVKVGKEKLYLNHRLMKILEKK